MKKSSEIGFFRRMYLKHLTRRQEKALKRNDIVKFRSLVACHFKVYFKKDMAQEVKKMSAEGKAVLHRYANMYIMLKHKKTKKTPDNMILYSDIVHYNRIMLSRYR